MKKREKELRKNIREFIEGCDGFDLDQISEIFNDEINVMFDELFASEDI